VTSVKITKGWAKMLSGRIELGLYGRTFGRRYCRCRRD